MKLAQQWLLDFAKSEDISKIQKKNAFRCRMGAEMDVIRMSVTRQIIRSGNKLLEEAGVWIKEGAGVMFSAPEALPFMAALKVEADKFREGWFASPADLFNCCANVINAAAKHGLVIESDITCWTPNEMFNFLEELAQFRDKQGSLPPDACCRDLLPLDQFWLAEIVDRDTSNPLNRRGADVAVPISLGIAEFENLPWKRTADDNGVSRIVTLKEQLEDESKDSDN